MLPARFCGAILREEEEEEEEAARMYACEGHEGSRRGHPPAPQQHASDLPFLINIIY